MTQMGMKRDGWFSRSCSLHLAYTIIIMHVDSVDTAQHT